MCLWSCGDAAAMGQQSDVYIFSFRTVYTYFGIRFWQTEKKNKIYNE